MGTATSFSSAQPVTMNSTDEFAGLYERYYAAVYGTALRITGNPADAEDVLQTVFLRVLKGSGRLDSSRAPEPYFRRAATNASLDLLRRRISHRETGLEEAHSQQSKESTAFLKQMLRRALASLDPSDSVMFTLRYVEGMTNSELAEIYDQEKNSIAVRLHRIRQALQDELERI